MDVHPRAASYPMAPCILHVGMPKTGTSSIQDSLFHGLSDPRFRYVSLGHVNSAIFLATLFGSQPETFWLFRRSRRSPDEIDRMRRGFAARLRRVLRTAAARGQTPIISAEYCWQLTEAELARLSNFFTTEGFVVRIIAYIRPIRSWLESHFQQSVKIGGHAFDPTLAACPAETRPYHYAGKLAAFERVFGRENLTVRPFIRAGLAGGCVVRDFCGTLGVTLDPRAVIRSNDALSGEAVRLLYAYNRFRSPAAVRSVNQRFLLLKRMEEVTGDPLRFHAAAVAPMTGEIAAQERVVRDRYGLDIAADTIVADGADRVRTEADLFRYSAATLEWLASASGAAAIGRSGGEATARQIAAAMERLRQRPAARTRLALLASRARNGLRWMRHGD